MVGSGCVSPLIKQSSLNVYPPQTKGHQNVLIFTDNVFVFLPSVKCAWSTPAFFAEKLHKAMDVGLHLLTSKSLCVCWCGCLCVVRFAGVSMAG